MRVMEPLASATPPTFDQLQPTPVPRPNNTPDSVIVPVSSNNGDTSSSRVRRRLPFSPLGAGSLEASFGGIHKSFKDFDDELKKLSGEVMHLGRVSGLLRSVKKLRKQLVVVESSFLFNVASLNPDIYHSNPEFISLAKDREYEQLPSCLQELATRFQIFRNRLDEFHERTDEGARLREELNSFIRNIKYRGHCINHYQGRLNTIPIQQYVDQLGQELASELRDLLPVLEAFIAIGVPAIRYEQKRSSFQFMNMSTVATLFSSVTATTLQMSASSGGSADESLMFIVNVLWIWALVFSVGATLNSFLSMAWRQARTGSRSPLVIQWWVSSSPLTFLVLALSSFSAGLILFAYASHQAIFTAPLTVAATTLTFVGLFGAPFGMLYDKWMSYRRDAHDETDDPPPQEDISSIMTRSMSSLAKREEDWSDEEEKIAAPKQQVPGPPPSTPKIAAGPRLKHLTRDVSIQNMVLSKFYKRQPSQKGPSSPILNAPSVKKNWKSVANAAVAQQGLHSKPVRSAHLITNLTIANRHGPIRFSQFSPVSPHLVITCVKEDRFTTATWTAVYDIQSGTTKIADMWHEGCTRLIGRGVLWSPNGQEVLVHFDHELHIWDYTRHVVRTLRTRHTTRAVVWLDAHTILTAENGRIHKRSRSHRIMETYALDNLNIRHMAIEPSHNYLVILARVKAPLLEASPIASQKQEKRIIVYDMDQKNAVYQLPVLENIQSIQISRFGLHMLINSSETLFQAWEFDANLDSSNLHVIPILRRLTVVHPDDLGDDSCDYSATFGGIQDDFIYSVAPGGKVRVWRWRSNALELWPSYLLALGSEDDEAPQVQQLTWRPSSPTFAVIRHTTEGASVLQLWTAPEQMQSIVPIIRTASQASAASVRVTPPPVRPLPSLSATRSLKEAAAHLHVPHGSSTQSGPVSRAVSATYPPA